VKPGIHPKYQDVEVRCACGNTFTTRSTKPELHLEICSSCHPFFTGRQKLIDTEGRVERFTKRFGAQSAESRRAAGQAAKAAKAAKAATGARKTPAGRTRTPKSPANA
jgi:large subunit ribosomal protein L31